MKSSNATPLHYAKTEPLRCQFLLCFEQNQPLASIKSTPMPQTEEKERGFQLQKWGKGMENERKRQIPVTD